MELYHFTLTPTSPVVTPYRGDTLVGHILWMFAYRHGEEALASLLDALPEDPPAVTDLFPERREVGEPVLHLPRPHIPVPSSDELEDYRKEVKSIQYISIDHWRQLRSNLTGEALRDILLADARAKRLKRSERKPKSLPAESISELHATINRFSGAAGDLFTRIRIHFGEGEKLHGWLHPGVLGNEAQELFTLVGEMGYGADASTGCGRFMVDFSTSDANHNLFELSDANGWMSLSRHLPPKNVDLDRSFWKLETHYGRLGGAFAVSRNPFKKPIMLVDRGSVWTGPLPDKPAGASYGNVAFPPLDHKVRHVGYTIPLPFIWGETK